MSQPPYSPQPVPGDPNAGYQSAGYPNPGYQNPGPQNPGYPNPGYPNPGYPNPGYQNPGYPTGGEYPGYQNAPPAGYGMGPGMPPPGWGAAPPQVARPTTVTYAILALIANTVVGVLAAILVFANRDAYIDQALRNAGLDPSAANATSGIIDAGYRVGAIIGLVFLAIWAMFVWFAWKGQNWARVVIWVFGGLSLIGVFTAFSSPVGFVVALNVLNLLLTLAAVVLLALKPSNDWYRYQRDARRYSWPGQA